MATKAADKSEQITDPTPGSTENPAGTAGIPPTPEGGKGERRLFQDGPGDKKWMTKSEAKKAGKHWRDDD